MQKFTLNILLIAVGLCSFSNVASCCTSLRFTDNTPIVTEESDETYTVSFNFSHGNTGGTYRCFVRELETSQSGECPATPQQQTCEPMQTITMTGLRPGGWFSCGVRCSLGNVQRRISRSFPTPAASGDCCPYLINDGASFADYNNGSAMVTFEWASTGSFSGFQCRVDFGMSFPCTSPHIEMLSAPDQHAFEVVPQNCMGNFTKTLLRRIEVPAETCVQPFSIT